MKTLNNNTVVAVVVLIILLPIGYSVVGSALSLGSSGSEPFLELPDAKDGERCVVEKEYGQNARFAHMHFLKEIREEAVRKGNRGDVGFDTCWTCHANKERGTSRARFCDKCHVAVNLYLNCFQCHLDPDSTAETGH